MDWAFGQCPARTVPHTEGTVDKCVSPLSCDSWVPRSVIPFLIFDVHCQVPATVLGTDGSPSFWSLRFDGGAGTENQQKAQQVAVSGGDTTKLGPWGA